MTSVFPDQMSAPKIGACRYREIIHREFTFGLTRSIFTSQESDSGRTTRIIKNGGRPMSTLSEKGLSASTPSTGRLFCFQQDFLCQKNYLCTGTLPLTGKK